MIRVLFPKLCICLSLIVDAAAHAQQLPPVEPPKPMPSTAPNGQTLQVTTTEVLVPTLVEKKDGAVIYGLKASDFVVEDDGVPQKIRVQEEMDTAPVALVVAVEEGGASVLEFDKLAHLGPLLDEFLAEPGSRVALIGFDSQPHLIQDFTHAGDEINNELRHLEPGDGGAAILDTVAYGVSLLELQPKKFRRVLLVVSEERDHGSKHTKPVQLIKSIGESDVLVLSVSFSPSRAEFLHDAADNGDDRTLSMVSALAMAVKAFKKNVSKEIAQMSGGEYTTFTNDKKFEARVVEAASHTRNRYLITFSPSNPKPGLHAITVNTAVDYGARIVARADYWSDQGQ